MNPWTMFDDLQILYTVTALGVDACWWWKKQEHDMKKGRGPGAYRERYAFSMGRRALTSEAC
jgi:hypothetical protein